MVGLAVRLSSYLSLLKVVRSFHVGYTMDVEYNVCLLQFLYSFLSWSLCLPGWLILRPYVLLSFYSARSLCLSCLLSAWAELITGFPPLAQAPGLVNHLPLLNLVFLATT